MADGNKQTGDKLLSREQYVGADFGSLGKLIAGKTLDSTRQVMAATDILNTLMFRMILVSMAIDVMVYSVMTITTTVYLHL